MLFRTRSWSSRPSVARGLIARLVSSFTVVALFVTACDPHVLGVPGAPLLIDVTPDPTLVVGTTQQFTAIGYDFEDRVATITPVWAASAGGTINATGLFTAGGLPGVFPAAVSATSNGLTGTANVTVVAGALATISVTPNPDTTQVLTTQQFVAVGRDAFNNVVPITPGWTVFAGGGAINGTGLFTAGAAPGTFTNTVRATSGAIFGSATVVVTTGALATITVTPNPDTTAILSTQAFVAVGRDAGNNVVAITPAWTVTNGGGAINGGSGLFTAGAATGTFLNTVRATDGAVFGTATVVVTAGPAVTIEITPNPDTTAVLGTQQFVAVGRDASNNIVPITEVWSVTNGGGAINGTGLFTAGNVTGTFTNTVRATDGALFGEATVVVSVGPAVTITVTPNPDTTATLATQQFTAVGRDAANNVVPITKVWSVTNGGGTINTNGRFTAGNVAGTFLNTVRATDGGLFGEATVVVVAAAAPFVPLGEAEFHGILAATEITCITAGFVDADIGVSPGNTMTGFDGACSFSGVANLANAASAQAQVDLTAAYNTLAGLPCPPANSIVADLGSTTLQAGVYCTAIDIGVTGDLTLDGNGDPDAVFVFQAGTALTTAGNVILIGGAQAKNVYWQVGSSATLGTGSQWQGNILAQISITLVDAATLNGRALARTGAVTLGSGNTITLP